MTDSEVQQLIVWVGTQAKIDEARQQGQITNDDFVVVTDAPEFALQSTVQAIQALIPSQATAQNQLADKNYVDNSALPSSTKYGASFTLSINSTDYKVTATLKDQDGNTLGTSQVIDLPLESVVVGGTYDSTNKKIVLTLQNGNTIDVPVGDLVAGLQTEITAQNKLSSDLVDDSNTTNKFATSAEKNTWNNKQDKINDLETIRAGASAGASALQPSALNGYVPYSGATGAVDLNAKDLKNVDNLAVGTATVDNNEKILSVGQNRIVSNNQNGLFISSTTSQTRKGMYGVPMALEIQFNSNNQAYSYPLGFHDMNANNNGGQFLFTSFSGNISVATAGDVMVENDKGGLIFNTGNSKSGSKMRFTVGNWQSTPQLTLTANGVGVKTTNPNSSYALDVNGTLNASNILINGQPLDVGGDANVQYTGGGGVSGSLIDTNTQQEIPLSQINDMPQVLQDIRDSIPTDTSDLTNNAGFVTSTDLQNDYVTIATSQKMLAAKAIFGTDVAFGSDTTQKNLLAVISNSNSTAGNWIGRLTVGAKNKTFIMGTYGTICVLGAHSWTNAQQGTGAAWEPVYINPDGDKAVYIGGSPINGKQALMVLQNVNANTTGTVKINRSTNLTNNFKDVACWSDDVRKFSFTSISGYNASVNQTLTHDSSGNLKWVNS